MDIAREISTDIFYIVIHWLPSHAETAVFKHIGILCLHCWGCPVKTEPKNISCISQGKI